jgi:hypothetical protein
VGASQLAALAIHDQHGGSEVLPLLAECDGPVGPAMSLAMAYALVTRHEADRVAGVDAFLLLDASGEPFAASAGRDLADLAACGLVKLGRSAAPPVDATGPPPRRPSGNCCWRRFPGCWSPLRAACPGCSSPRRRSAAVVGARDEIPGLSALAGRKGTSRVLKEARCLRSVLISQA